MNEEMESALGIGMWYDKSGKVITDYDEMVKLFSNREYKIVKQETLPNGLWVSTVWLCLNHRFGAGKPFIFETMVFRNEEDLSCELDVDRYSTENEARLGHEKMVNKWKSKNLTE